MSSLAALRDRIAERVIFDQIAINGFELVEEAYDMAHDCEQFARALFLVWGDVSQAAVAIGLAHVSCNVSDLDLFPAFEKVRALRAEVSR